LAYLDAVGRPSDIFRTLERRFVMRGNIESVTKSKSGKAWRVKIGDKFYGANFDSKIDSQLGKAVDFEYEDGKYGLWLKSWGPDTAVMGSAVPASGQAAIPAQSFRTNGGDRWFMPFVSNCVAHCIAAGLIKEPTQIGPWARAAYRVAVVELDRAFEEKKGKFEDSMGDVPF